MKDYVLSVLFVLMTVSTNCFAQATELPKGEMKKALSPLEGAWMVIDVRDGVEKEDDEGIWFEFKGDKLIAHYEGEKEIANYKIDVRTQQFVITTKDTIVHAIYKLEQEILTFCYYQEDKEFPKTFELEEGKNLVRLKLMKAAKKKFLGKWDCIEAWEMGEKGDEEETKTLTFRISAYLFEIFDDEEQVDENGNDLESDESFLISIDEKLKRIQLNDQMGDTFNCIYKFEDGLLIIHFYDSQDDEGKNADYPKNYEITDDSVLLKLKKN